MEHLFGQKSSELQIIVRRKVMASAMDWSTELFLWSEDVWISLDRFNIQFLQNLDGSLRFVYLNLGAFFSVYIPWKHINMIINYNNSSYLGQRFNSVLCLMLSDHLCLATFTVHYRSFIFQCSRDKVSVFQNLHCPLEQNASLLLPLLDSDGNPYHAYWYVPH